MSYFTQFYKNFFKLDARTPIDSQPIQEYTVVKLHRIYKELKMTIEILNKEEFKNLLKSNFLKF